MIEPRHCDDYIDDPTQPECLRTFLDHARAPAHGANRGDKPPLFASYNGRRVRVVMASRFGDVGITTKLDAEYGYDKRVAVDQLTAFSRDSDAMLGTKPEGLSPEGVAARADRHRPTSTEDLL